ncbi:MAG: hypothetical protein M3220_12945 [Chloroflexota bacterium]|nr:hypothetical protein [Chloroflexota bacterium]
MTTTGNLMQLALDLVGWKNIPGDCGIYVSGRNIKRLLVGLDIDTGDLLLAREAGFDAVLAHHPTGTPASLTSWQVYRRHTELLMHMGIPRYAAEAAVEGRVQELRMQAHTSNYDRVSSAAQLIGIPFFNIHSPQDELGRQMMQAVVDDLLGAEPDATVGEVAAHLTATFPEFLNAPTRIAVRVGDPDRRAGRTVVVHGALTNGGARIARTYWEHGVNTVIYIHIAPSELKALASLGRQGNLIVTGHIAGDSLGVNAYLAEVEERLGLEVTRLNGIVSPERE